MGKRKATVQPEDEASSYEDEQSVDDTAYYSIRCITGRAPQTQRSGLAEPKEVKAEFKVGLAPHVSHPIDTPIVDSTRPRVINEHTYRVNPACI